MHLVAHKTIKLVEKLIKAILLVVMKCMKKKFQDQLFQVLQTDEEEDDEEKKCQTFKRHSKFY